MSERRYFYLGGEPIHAGIYADLLARLDACGVRSGLISRVRVTPTPAGIARARRPGDRIGPNTVQALREKIPGGVFQLPIWNLMPSLSVPALMKLLRREAPGAKLVLHTRQFVMATLGLDLKRRWPDVAILAEIEGDDLAELDYRREIAPRASAMQRLRWAMERRHFDVEDRRILTESDAVLCVSHKLKEVLVRRYRLTPERAERLHVLPTFASRENFRFDPARRARTRASGGFQDRYLVIYSGNLRAPWQVPHKLVEVFAAIRARRPDAYFLILTPIENDRQYIEPHLRAAGLAERDWSIGTAAQSVVIDHLCAADVGLLLRDRHPMNEAASPGKFAEYLLTGLPIIATEGIGDYSGQVQGQPLACVLPGLDDSAALREQVQRFCMRNFQDAERAAFSQWAGERFAVETVVPRLADLYRSV